MAREYSPSLIASMRRNFIIGRCRDGSWFVRAVDGFVEATFHDRSEAIRFARSESGHCWGAAVLTPYAGSDADGLEAACRNTIRRDRAKAH
ncbi:hypothetical protein [Phreatobacter stygius]|uniref:DUF2188 domain-containing protein n=1 Tax=Phreatobacter stygius TaxID=1940610 RepID=A0A4D7B7H2_9HYPH|nr:hypothetical protein [Phreatobacter stygius]QCI66945.1 hypothetical protein E8M01_23490 [Phreatobacter stygius]